MKFFASLIILCFLFSIEIEGGEHKRDGFISPKIKDRIDAITECAKSNDLAGVRREYIAIDWRLVKQKDVAFKAIAKVLPKGKQAKELRREIATKYMLLRDKEDDKIIEDLSDVEAYKIKIIDVPVLNIDVQDIPAIYFLPYVQDSIISSFISCQFLKIGDAQYEKAMDTWLRRWSIAIDAVGVNGVRVVPHPYSELGIRRALLMRSIEYEGWSEETEKMWAQYYFDLSIALNRRDILKNEGVSSSRK